MTFPIQIKMREHSELWQRKRVPPLSLFPNTQIKDQGTYIREQESNGGYALRCPVHS